MRAQKPDHPTGQDYGGDAATSVGLWQRLELRLQGDEEANGLWPRLDERLHQARTCPCLREGLQLNPLPAESHSFVLSDPAAGCYFRLGGRESFILSLLDGEHAVDDVVEACSQRFSPTSTRAVEQFLQDLRVAGLLEEGSGLWGYLRFARRGRATRFWSIPETDSRLPKLHRALRFLFHPLAWPFYLGLFAGAVLLLALYGGHLRADLEALSSSPWRMLLFVLGALYPAMALVVLSHEVAHALACIHFGGRVFRLGLMMRHLLPAAFADVSDIWLMPRKKRVLVLLAGPVSTVVWGALATGLWAWTRAASFPHLLGGAVMLASFVSAWVSLNPVGGYDGSEVLSEWLEVPNLHRQALSYTWARLRGRAQPNPPLRERKIFWGYSAGVLFYNLAVVALVLFLLLRSVLR